MTAEVAAGGSTDIRELQISFPDAELDRAAPAHRGDQVARATRRSTTTRRACRSRPCRSSPATGRRTYDWRGCEARLNALPNFLTEIDGLDIHFIHVRSRHEDALPLIVTHGWPGSIIEQLKIIGPLTDPTSHGGSEADAFHLVIPSLPGHGFSAKPTATGWDPARIARAWVVLMHRLGLHRVRGAGRRLGRGRDADHGRAGAARAARHPLQHAGHRAGRRRQGLRARRPAAVRPLGRGATRVRPAARLLRDSTWRTR